MVVVMDEPDLQHQWDVVGSDGKALRRSKRKVREIVKKKMDTKDLIRKITTRNNAMANIKITTTTSKNNSSTIQINKTIKNKNKNLTRIKNKEQRSEEELSHIGKVHLPMLLDLIELLHVLTNRRRSGILGV
jgi:predicted phage tail protein